MGKQMNVILVASAVLVFLVGLDLNAGIMMNIILKSAQPKVCIFIPNSPPSRRKHTLWQPRAVLLPIHMDRTKLQQQQHFPRSHLWRHHWRTWHRSMRSTPARDRSVYKSKFILCPDSLPVTKCPALCLLRVVHRQRTVSKHLLDLGFARSEQRCGHCLSAVTVRRVREIHL